MESTHDVRQGVLLNSIKRMMTGLCQESVLRDDSFDCA